MKRYVAAYARRAGIKSRPGVTAKALAKLRRAAMRDFRQHVGANWRSWPSIQERIFFGEPHESSAQTVRNRSRHVARTMMRQYAL